MKKVGLFVCILAAMTLSASGQMLITFNDMPSVDHPAVMPDNYPTSTYLNWENFFYVSPAMWNGSGPGFFTGPDLRVAFVGGPMCELQPSVCYGSIKLGVAPNSTATFQPLSITLAAGWAPNNVEVLGFNKSQYLGRITWKLTLKAHQYFFPDKWTNVTQLILYPTPTQGSAIGKAGSFVAYTFYLNMNQ